MKKLGKVRKTGRGFEIINFIDKYGDEASLQQSSLAEYEEPGMSAVWIGLDHEKYHLGEKLGARMHLDREQVEALIYHLQNWLENNSFE